MDERPDKLGENWRNPDGTLKPGHPPMGGRPKGKTLKEYQAEQFRNMSDEEKAEWLKDVQKDLKWKMGEGMPSQGVELSGETKMLIKIDE